MVNKRISTKKELKEAIMYFRNKKEIKIEEVPIKTIYIGENETSHFNPIRDSILIYKLFFKRNVF